jgi:hypothetical protein
LSLFCIASGWFSIPRGAFICFFFLKKKNHVWTGSKIFLSAVIELHLGNGTQDCFSITVTYLAGIYSLSSFYIRLHLYVTFQVGIVAWKNARDSTGFSPEDYARLRGHYSYIHLVQKKSKRQVVGHVVLDIPSNLSNSNIAINEKQNEGLTSGFEIGHTELRPIQRNCKLCSQKVVYGTASRSQLYRPAMFSMVAIAAVCVCVALLFKSCPEVLYVFRPFRWELLDYGTS